MLYPMAGTKTEKKMTWILKGSTTYLLCVVVGESYVYSKEEESKLGTHEDFLFFPFFSCMVHYRRNMFLILELFFVEISWDNISFTADSILC